MSKRAKGWATLAAILVVISMVQSCASGGGDTKTSEPTSSSSLSESASPSASESASESSSPSDSNSTKPTASKSATASAAPTKASSSALIKALNSLPVKGRAPKTGYSRDLFSDGWGNIGQCDTRNYILQRDLTNIVWRSGESCIVESGRLHDPYTNSIIDFLRGVGTSNAVQIDHVVALSDAWQKGAQKLSSSQRYALYNDPLNLLAVDGPTNGQKSDSDAASWLPPNKSYRCSYVARQVAVKKKYSLWVTAAEKEAIQRVLAKCPKQKLPKN